MVGAYVQTHDNRKALIALAAVSILLTVAVQAYLWGDTTDDAFIAFRYVARFVRGEGLTFNAGERVEGYSSPLWVLLLAGLNAATSIPLPLFARLLGLVCFALVLALCWRIMSSPHSNKGLLRLSILFVLLILSPGFQYYTGAGLETPLVGLLLVLGVWFALRESDWAASLAFGLVGIVRPEGILYVVAWILWKWIYRRDKFFAHVSISVLPWVAWEAFRVMYYGAWVPNTALAKPWGGVGDLGFFYVARFLVAPTLTLAFVWIARRRIARLEPEEAKIFWLCLALTIAGLIFVMYAKGDWMSFGRFVVQFLPVAVIAFALLLSSQELSGRQQKRSIAVLFIAQLCMWYVPIHRYVTNLEYSMLMKCHDPLIVAEWIHAHYPPHTTLATVRLGAISFIADDFIVWDLAGLTDREEALNRLSKSGLPDPILLRHPHLIIEPNLPGDRSYHNDVGYLSMLQTNFHLVKSFPQGRLGTMDVWERK